jgi:hypothetical protein
MISKGNDILREENKLEENKLEENKLEEKLRRSSPEKKLLAKCTDMQHPEDAFRVSVVVMPQRNVLDSSAFRLQKRFHVFVEPRLPVVSNVVLLEEEVSKGRIYSPQISAEFFDFGEFLNKNLAINNWRLTEWVAGESLTLKLIRRDQGSQPEFFSQIDSNLSEVRADSIS